METNSPAKLLAIVTQETGIVATLETRIADLNLDSLEYIELLQEISNKFQKHIPDEVMTHAETVGDLLKAVV